MESWENAIVLGGTVGPTGVEFRHCTINGDEGINNWGYVCIGIKMEVLKLVRVKICDCDFTLGKTAVRGNKIVKGSSLLLTKDKIQIDANNTYAIGQTAALASFNSNTEYDIVNLSGDCANLSKH